MKREWYDLPANAKTIMDVQSCIGFLQHHHPYPANMKPDRKNFAVARLGYEAAIYQLEKFMCELTETIEIAMIEDEQMEEE